MVEPVNKMELYRITHWFSKDCEKMLKDLEEHGLCVVKKQDIIMVNNHELRMMDDGR